LAGQITGFLAVPIFRAPFVWFLKSDHMQKLAVLLSLVYLNLLRPQGKTWQVLLIFKLLILKKNLVLIQITMNKNIIITIEDQKETN